MYGLMNVFILKNFVVPLPIIYFAIPIVALYFFWLSIRSKISWYLLIMPFIVLKDVMMDFNVNLVAIVSIISLVSWGLFGVLILRQKYVVSTVQKVYGIALIFSIFTLIPTDFNLTWVCLPLVGIMGFIFAKNFESKLSLIKLKNSNRPLEYTTEVLDDDSFLKKSKNHNQLTLQRINLLVLLICGFYMITLFSIWTNTW